VENQCERVSSNNPVIVNGGSYPYGKYLDDIFKINAITGKQSIAVKVNCNLHIWADLAWAVCGIEELNLPAFFKDLK